MIRMAKPTQETTTLQIARDHVEPLIATLGMVRNELAPLFDLPPESAGTKTAATAWWQKLSEEQKYPFRSALAALAAPQLVVDIGINAKNERLTNTHAVIPSMRWNDPIFLLAAENGGAQFRLEYLKQADLFTNTLLLYLDGGATLHEMEMKFEVAVRDFAVLLATADLRQKLRFQALINHDVFPDSLPAGDVASMIGEAFAIADPRWLLPFCLPVLHLSADSFTPATVGQSLDNLVKLGLMKKNGDLVTLTEPGEAFAESVSERISSLGIDTYGVDAAGNHGRQSVLFIRGANFLWYAGVGGTAPDSIVVTSIGLDQAEKVLQELFTPVAAPKPSASGATATAVPPVAQAAAPASSKAPSGKIKKFCPSCGTAIKPGKKFCSNCGGKIE